MKTTGQQFKDAFRDAYAPIMKPGEISQDFNKYTREMKEEEKLKVGKGDKMTLKDLAKKHKVSMEAITDQFIQGVKVEQEEHTNDRKKAMEIAMDHLSEDPKYYNKLKKMETKEQLIVKPVKKSVVDKFLGKGDKMHKPIGKIFYMTKGEVGEETEKTTAKREFAKDLQKDKDFEEFKKNAKYEKGGATFTFGVPNVASEDPYIKKKTKYGRPGRGKEETKEATGSGSSGAFSGPIAFEESDFMRRSFAETPKKLKEGIDLEKVEAKEATTSVGGYETPAMWAKTTKKKDWGPSRKTQYPGGSFVKVKKKCTKFPYCNQGDINALKLSKNESVKEAIENISKKYGIGKNVIITILEHEFEKINKRKK